MAGRDVARQHLSLPNCVLGGGRGDLAGLRQVWHRGRVAGRENVGVTGHLQVGLHLQPATLGRQSQLLDQRGSGHSGHPRDGVGVDPRIIAQHNVIGLNFLQCHAETHVDVIGTTVRRETYGLDNSFPNFIANHGRLPPGRSLPRTIGDHCGMRP